MRARCVTLAAVMPVESSLESLRCGSRPNSGQSRRLAADACAAAGIAPAPAVGVATSAGALLPQAASITPTDAVAPRRMSWRGTIEMVLSHPIGWTQMAKTPQVGEPAPD